MCHTPTRRELQHLGLTLIEHLDEPGFKMLFSLFSDAYRPEMVALVSFVQVCNGRHPSLSFAGLRSLLDQEPCGSAYLPSEERKDPIHTNARYKVIDHVLERLSCLSYFYPEE